MIEYTSSRLSFKADIIEALDENESFAVNTPEGTFQFTKAEFYRVFPNVIKTVSYQERRLYSYKYSPKRALQFLRSNVNIEKDNMSKSKSKNDLVGTEIRMKIQEIGQLWRCSPSNPRISEELLRKWDNLIEEWIEDETMPLVVRKNTSKRGQSISHPSGREIIISDNTLAIWAFHNVLHNKIPPLDEIKNLLRENKLPIVFMTTKEIMTHAKYTSPLGVYALNDWKLCHIQPVGFNTNTDIEDLDIKDIKEHFRKYANPNNMFVLPKEIGDLGEIDVFIQEQKRDV